MTDLQTTNRVKVSKVRETTFGVTPTNPAFKEQRTTSSGLNAGPQTVVTGEIRSDRQVTDLILVGQQAGGDMGGELSFRGADDHFEEAVQGTWSNKPSIEVTTQDTEISDVSTTTLTVAAGGASFKTGHLTITRNFATAANNKLARVSSSTATTIVYPAATFAAEVNPIPVGASVRVVGFEGASGDLAAVTSGGNGLTSSALDFTTLGLVVCEWLRIVGAAAGTQFATAGANGWCRISAVAATKLSFDIVPTGWAADAGAGKTIQCFVGDILRNASTKRSNTFERQYLDHSPVSYEYLRGQTLNTMSINLQAQQIATYSLAYIGADGIVQASRVAGATDTAATTNDVLNTSANVGRIGLGGAAIAGPSFVMSATVEINNNIRRQSAVGSVGAVGTGNGEFAVTGTLETYFGDSTILDKILANSETSFDLRLGRADGEREQILIDLPRLKFSAGAPAVPGKNQDVMISGQFQAIRHATLGYTIHVQRNWYLPS